MTILFILIVLRCILLWENRYKVCSRLAGVGELVNGIVCINAGRRGLDNRPR